MGGPGMGTAGPGFGRGMGPRVGMGRGGMMGGMADGGMGFGGGYGPMGNEGPGFGNFKDQIEMGGDMMGGGAMGQGGGSESDALTHRRPSRRGGISMHMGEG